MLRTEGLDYKIRLFQNATLSAVPPPISEHAHDMFQVYFLGRTMIRVDDIIAFRSSWPSPARTKHLLL